MFYYYLNILFLNDIFLLFFFILSFNISYTDLSTFVTCKIKSTIFSDNSLLTNNSNKISSNNEFINLTSSSINYINYTINNINWYYLFNYVSFYIIFILIIFI